LWNVRAPKTDRIVSIEDAGVEDVYDIQMRGPHHTFVANGIVVSNSGKTCQSIGAILLNKVEDNGHKTLVVCPSSVKHAWEDEINAMSDLSVTVLSSSMHARQEQYLKMDGADVLVVSFDGFLSDFDDLATVFKPDILIVDECHRLANRANKITQALIGGRNIRKTFTQMASCHSVYLLTGTPITNKLEDLYPMLKLIDPGIFSWSGFTNRYTVMEQLYNRKIKRHFTKIAGYKNEKELKAKLSLHMIRRTKDEVLAELPAKVFQTIEIELGTEERRIYNQLKKDFKTEVRGKELSVVDTLSWLTRAQQICNSLETLPDSKAKKSSKLDEMLKIVNAEAPNRKIVIFSKYKTMTNIICRELVHLNPVHLNGGVKDDDRKRIIKQFQEDTKTRVFVSTLGAGGVGITLTAADMVILYDRHWAPGGNTQAIDRLHRFGQKNSVLVVTLRVVDSVEDRIQQVWLRKQALIQNMVGDEAILGKLAQEELKELI
jgi:SNF2 family DNA or RNA helicase